MCAHFLGRFMPDILYTFCIFPFQVGLTQERCTFCTVPLKISILFNFVCLDLVVLEH